ncbi:hypothetical protein ABBQ32_009409 [Trebouxia sp. C0010 RCD-2024]
MRTLNAASTHHVAFSSRASRLTSCSCLTSRVTGSRLPASLHSSGNRFLRRRMGSHAKHRQHRVSTVAGTLEPGKCTLVVGATGGVGQVLTGKLLDRGFKVKALSRNPEKARELFGGAKNLELVQGDCREASQLQKVFDGVDAVICVLGTSAFPSARWKGGNGPEQTDFIATGNLIRATPKGVKRFVLVTSAGVERFNKLPFSILNLFGVLKYKRQSEELLMQSGLPYTILRPGRLTDGPYTSYDLNTLLQATAGNRQDIQVAAGDELNGETSRIALAEALLQSLLLSETENRVFALTSTEGEGPGTDTKKWQGLFQTS